ncbi:hypothetical protein IGI52_000437 [Enterococcus sp. DIV0187]
MTNEEYIIHITKVLSKENIEPHLQVQILETITELLEYYSVDFVRELLPTLFNR